MTVSQVSYSSLYLLLQAVQVTGMLSLNSAEMNKQVDKQTEASMYECSLHLRHRPKHSARAFKPQDNPAVVPHLTLWESKAFESKSQAQGDTK